MTIVEARNPLQQLGLFGQSVWYDNIRRSLVSSGELERMVRDDGLTGVTSNPAIFEQAIAGSDEYAAAIGAALAAGIHDPKAIYETLAVEDVRAAADVLLPVYRATGGDDGYVSLEVAPDLAHDAYGTVAEAARLWDAVARPNMMIKVPATPAGIDALEALTACGRNVNVTLLFSPRVYEEVALAYLRGLERLVAAGGDPSAVASVASFFVSRVDSALPGRGAAVANARLAYARSRALYAGSRWDGLAELGARPQRLLWASTGTKDPQLSDVLYVEELIGPDTVNTMPPATYEAFREHGTVRRTVDGSVEEARATIAAITDFEQVAERLLDDGLTLFRDAFERLLAVVAARASRSLPPPLAADAAAIVAEWESGEKAKRLWAGDATLWTDSGEELWLGWLRAPQAQLARVETVTAFADEVAAAGFKHIVLLGMGGSSLAPELLARTFGSTAGFPELRILDSTNPAQIRSVENTVDLDRTLFVVSSKSGSTLEPNILLRYFFERVSDAVGEDEAATRFVAVTDPSSSLHLLAKAAGFRAVFEGDPAIGGRYSALSPFGTVPAALAGLDLPELLRRAERMAERCARTAGNPGVELGAVLGAAVRHGRDKLTLVVSPHVAALGAWLEQLVAESTGKQGTGIVPIDGEPLGPPEVYGDDRLFVHVRLESAPSEAQDAAVARLAAAGLPVLTIDVGDPYDLGAEMVRWEVATAVAGSVIGINPFDQPDVEASKIATRALTEEYERTGRLDTGTPLALDAPDLVARLRAHLALAPNDYVALLAYLPMAAEHTELLDEIRTEVRDARRAATALGYGPRFLHSTGQAYKGGPNTGVFLQLTCDAGDDDLAVPGRAYTFGVVSAAQASGDLAVLAELGRRVLHVHLGADVAAGLTALRDAVRAALAQEEST